MLQWPNPSAREHSFELGIGNRSVRRILHENLHSHHYKLVVVELSKLEHYAKRFNFAGQMKAIFAANDNPILLMNDETITVIIELLKIRENSSQNHCIIQKWRSGVLLVKLPSLVLTFLKTIMEMLWLWTPSATPRWSTTSLCLNYDEKVGLFRNASMKTGTTWRILFIKLKFVKCLFNVNTAMSIKFVWNLIQWFWEIFRLGRPLFSTLYKLVKYTMSV